MEKEFKLINDMVEIARLEEIVEELGTELNLSPDIVMNINLALEEAIANIIMYAYPSLERHEIRLKITSSEQQLIFLLTDKGVSFDPTQVEEADLSSSIEERPVGGLGVFLIRQIMNEVIYERIDGENKLTMKKNIDL